MKILVDGRVLKHKYITGVENHAINVIQFLGKKIKIDVAEPKYVNKYYTHFWEHIILPIKASNYDILYCPSNIAPLFLSNKVKLVVTLHDLSFKDFTQMYSSSFRKYYEFVIPKVINRANKVLTISKFSYQRILGEYPTLENKMEYIYHGKNEIFFYDKSVEKQDYILYVGSLNDTKNFSAVLKAYNQLKCITTKLVMVAPKSNNFILSIENEKLLKNAYDNPMIEIIGYLAQEELLNYYQQARVFVFPSLHESFGFPVLEAMTCGTAVVCSNITALPEIGKDAVVYCDPYSVNDINEKITLVLKDSGLQKRMIEKGLAVASQFNWEHAVKGYIKIFTEVTEH